MDRVFKNISVPTRFFILIFIFSTLIRLWCISNPLLDYQSWRQTASAMVSRNYVKDMDFFRPRTDFDYPYPMAFGLYEYTVAAVGKIFGFTD